MKCFINSLLGNRIKYKNVNEKVIITSKVIFLPLNFNYEKQVENGEYIHYSGPRLSYVFLSAVKILGGGLTAVRINCMYYLPALELMSASCPGGGCAPGWWQVRHGRKGGAAGKD